MLCGLFRPASALGEEGIEVLSPTGAVQANMPLKFRIRLHDSRQLTSGLLHHRVVGQQSYTASPMAKTGPNEFSIVLSAKSVVVPGLEYFVTAEDQSKSRISFPKLTNNRSPLQIRALPNQQTLDNLLLTPSNGAVIQSLRPEIAAFLPKTEPWSSSAKYRLFLNGEPVTSQCQVLDRGIRYVPKHDLLPGEHVVRFELADKEETIILRRSWRFRVNDPWFDRASTSTSVNSANAGPISQTYNAHLSTRLEKEGVSLDLELGIDDHTSSQAGVQADTAAIDTYLLQLGLGGQNLFLGDIQIGGNGLSGGTLSGEGGKLFLNVLDTRGEFFFLGEGLNDDGNSPTLLGGSLERELIEGGMLTLTGTMVRGKDILDREGTFSSIAASSSLLDDALRLQAEYSVSGFSRDEDSDGPASAWRFQADGGFAGYGYTLRYARLEPEFATPFAAPENDVEEIVARLTKNFAKGNVRLDLSTRRDNLAEDAFRPIMRESGADLSYSLSLSNHAKLFGGVGLHTRQSLSEPDGYDSFSEMTRSLRLGLSLKGKQWKTTPQYSVTEMERFSPGGSALVRHDLSLESMLRPLDGLSFTPSVSYSLTEQDGALLSRKWRAGLQTGLEISDESDMVFSVALQENSNDWGAYSFLECTGKYTWHASQKEEGVQRSLSLTGGYTRSWEDGREDRDEIKLGLQLDLGFPENEQLPGAGRLFDPAGFPEQ